MGTWKFSIELYFSEVLKSIDTPTHKNDGFMLVREGIFFRLLSFCANGDRFTDHVHLARIISAPKNQCSIVWELCLRCGVLRPDGHGYSTVAWMNENDMLSNDESIQKPIAKEPIAVVRDEIQPDTEQAVEKAKIEYRIEEVKVCDKPETTPSQAPKQSFHKQAVRPNVWLSFDEIKQLKNEFTDEQITSFVDALSDYKSRSSTNYVSDYAAIRKWVIKSVMGKQKSKDVPQVEFPVWLTGDKR